MRIAHLLILVVLASAMKFLDDHDIYDQPSSLFTDEQLSQNSEAKKESQEPSNYLDEQLFPLLNAEQTQVFVAYEKDLPAQGDCIILYSECYYKGQSNKICKDPAEAMTFQFPVQSLYIPEGQQFSTVDSNSRSEVTFLTGDECLEQPIVMVDSQLDFLLAKSQMNWLGQSATGQLQGALIQMSQEQEQVDNTNSDSIEQSNTEQVENTEAQPEQEAQQQPEQQSSEQPQVEAQQSTESSEQVPAEQAAQSDQEQPQQTEQQPETEKEQSDQPQESAQQPQEEEKQTEAVIEKVEKVVEGVKDLQQAELDAQKQELPKDEPKVETSGETEASIDELPKTESMEPEEPSVTAEPLVGQVQHEK